MPRPEISLADLLTAVVKLRADDESAAHLAHLLRLDALGREAQQLSSGFRSAARPTTALRRLRVEPHDREALRAVPELAGTVPTTPSEGKQETDAYPQNLRVGTGDVQLTTVTRVPSQTAVGVPEWFQQVGAMDAPVTGEITRARHEMLFVPMRARGILSAALATRAESREIDIHRVIDRVTAFRPIERVPRLPIATLRKGVQLLLDRSPAMHPFWPDREEILRAILHVVGTPRVQVLSFVGNPGQVIDERRSDDATEWRVPARGTPVVLVTDLGIGGPLVNLDRATRRQWLAFVDKARGAGCPVVAFVPFPPYRWDAALAHAMTIVHWDRRTTAGSIRRVIGIGHGKS